MSSLRFMRNISWNGVSVAVNQAANLGVVAILSRLVSPEDFGKFAAISIITAFANVFNDFGTSSYLISKHDRSAATYNTVFMVNLLCSVLCFALVFGFAEQISTYFKTDIVWEIRLASFVFLSDIVGRINRTILEIELSFKAAAKVEMLATLFSVVVAIAAAAAGLGVIALVLQLLSRSFALAVGYSITTKWWPKLEIERSLLGDLFRFTGFLLLNNILGQTSRSADQFIIARYLNTASLGFYVVGYRIMLFPVQQLGGIINRVIFPTLSSMAGDTGRQSAAYSRTLTVFCALCFPLLVTVVTQSDNIVRLVLGETWMPVADFLPLFGVVGMIQCVQTTTGPIFLLRKRTDLGLVLQCVSTAVTIGAFLIGVQYGLYGMACAYLAANLVLFPVAFGVSMKLLGANMLSVLKLPLILLAGLSLAAFAATGLARLVVQGPAFLNLLVYGLLFALLLSPAAAVGYKRGWHQMIRGAA